MSLGDARKLGEVREALRTGDLKKAGQLARVSQLSIGRVYHCRINFDGSGVTPRPFLK